MTSSGGTGADANRLTFDDRLFLVMRRALGVPVVSQTVWRFDAALRASDVAGFHAGLARGPLNRRVARARVPGARDRWVRSSVVLPLQVSPAPVEDVLGWADEHARLDLDPERGPTWSLALASTTGGGSVLSFVTSHVVADGGLKLAALAAAASGRPLPRLPHDDTAADRAALRADLRDAARQVAGALRALPAAVRQFAPDGSPAGTPAAARGGPVVVVVADLAAADWQDAATQDGGTGNSLLVAVCAEIAVALGQAAAGHDVGVALPVSTRTDGDLRSNASTGVTVRIPTTQDGRVASLADVRARAKAAFTALSDGSRPDPLATARALLPLLPDGAVRRLAGGWPSPTALASNLGTLDEAVVAPTGVPARSILNRSITHGPTGQAGGLSLWWGTAGETATLCVACTDPDAVGSAAELVGVVEDVLARRGVHAGFW